MEKANEGNLVGFVGAEFQQIDPGPSHRLAQLVLGPPCVVGIGLTDPGAPGVDHAELPALGVPDRDQPDTGQLLLTGSETEIATTSCLRAATRKTCS